MEKEIYDISEARELISNQDAVLLYFYNDHCAPCISLRPKVQKLTRENFPKIELRFVNSEQNPDFSSEFGVYENPVLILFFEGKEFYRGAKYISMSALYEKIKRPYNIIYDIE